MRVHKRTVSEARGVLDYSLCDPAPHTRQMSVTQRMAYQNVKKAWLPVKKMAEHNSHRRLSVPMEGSYTANQLSLSKID